MSRRRRTGAGSGDTLFPFLAVLVSMMGSLILLLVVLTEQARRSDPRIPALHARLDELDRLLDRPIPEALLSTPEPLPPLVALRSFPEPEPLAPVELPPLVEVTLPPFAPPDHADLADELERLRQETEAVRGRLATVMQRTPDAEDPPAAVEQLAARASRLADRLATAERERETLAARLAESRATLAAADARPVRKFSVVPYTGPNGTRRRPVYLECTAAGVTLVPEDVRIGADDLRLPAGAAHPLAELVGATVAALPDADTAASAYPLLLVRPDGIGPYARAAAVLRRAGIDFGYELLPAEIELAADPPSPALAALAAGAARRGRQTSERLLADLAGLAPGGRLSAADDPATRFAGDHRTGNAGAAGGRPLPALGSSLRYYRALRSAAADAASGDPGSGRNGAWPARSETADRSSPSSFGGPSRQTGSDLPSQRGGSGAPDYRTSGIPGPPRRLERPPFRPDDFSSGTNLAGLETGPGSSSGTSPHGSRMAGPARSDEGPQFPAAISTRGDSDFRSGSASDGSGASGRSRTAVGRPAADAGMRAVPDAGTGIAGSSVTRLLDPSPRGTVGQSRSGSRAVDDSTGGSFGDKGGSTGTPRSNAGLPPAAGDPNAKDVAGHPFGAGTGAGATLQDRETQRSSGGHGPPASGRAETPASQLVPADGPELGYESASDMPEPGRRSQAGGVQDGDPSGGSAQAGGPQGVGSPGGTPSGADGSSGGAGSQSGIRGFGMPGLSGGISVPVRISGELRDGVLTLQPGGVRMAVRGVDPVILYARLRNELADRIRRRRGPYDQGSYRPVVTLAVADSDADIAPPLETLLNRLGAQTIRSPTPLRSR